MNIELTLGVLAGAIGFLFLYSGASKLNSLSAFRGTLLLIPYFPHRLARPTAIVIPLVEIVVALFVIGGYVWAKQVAAVLLIIFSAVAALAISKGQEIECNCFGSSSAEVLTVETIIRNGVFVGITLLSLRLPAAQEPVLSHLNSVAVVLLYLAISRAIENQHTSIEAR